jgi:hypothetical protein
MPETMRELRGAKPPEREWPWPWPGWVEEGPVVEVETRDAMDRWEEVVCTVCVVCEVWEVWEEENDGAGEVARDGAPPLVRVRFPWIGVGLDDLEGR